MRAVELDQPAPRRHDLGGLMGASCCSKGGPLSALSARRGEFLAFVSGRVRDAALAGDIVQACFAKAAARVGQLEDEASATAWFYRMLRNEITDHRRRRGAAERATTALAGEVTHAVEAVERTPRACACVARVVSTLKPEYVDALERIDVEGAAVKDFAAARGIAANNAGVRVFRAREALRKKVVEACGSCAEGGGCFDCTCDS